MVRRSSVMVRRSSVMVRRGTVMVRRGLVGSASGCCTAGPRSILTGRLSPLSVQAMRKWREGFQRMATDKCIT
jgi:hypothetical protein